MLSSNEREELESLAKIEEARRHLVETKTPDFDEFARQIARAGELLAQARKRRPEEGAATTQELGTKRPRSTEFLSAESTGIEASATLRMTHIPTAHAHVLEPDQDPLVTFELKNPSRRHLRLRVQSHIEGYTAHAVDTVEIPEGSPKETIDQLPTFFPGAVNQIREATRATLHVEVHDLDAPGSEHRTEAHRTFRVWLLPKTTAVLCQWDPGTWNTREMTRYLPCWVTPNAPEVMRLLRDAADHGKRGDVVGYQADESGVEKQVKALFEALKERGITYINSVLAIGASNTQVQRVRLPRESLDQRSANCLDGYGLVCQPTRSRLTGSWHRLDPRARVLGVAQVQRRRLGFPRDDDDWLALIRGRADCRAARSREDCA